MADYSTYENYSAVARINKVNGNTVKRIVNNNPEIMEKVKQKKEQNTVDILEHMESKKKEVTNFIDTVLTEINDKEKVKRTSIKDLATSMGIVIDKFTMAKMQEKDYGEFEKLVKGLKDI